MRPSVTHVVNSLVHLANPVSKAADADAELFRGFRAVLSVFIECGQKRPAFEHFDVERADRVLSLDHKP